MRSEAYQEGQGARHKIERWNGKGKDNHGLRRCRYVGWTRYVIQAYLTAMGLNFKRMVRLLTGTTFTGRASVAA